LNVTFHYLLILWLHLVTSIKLVEIKNIKSRTTLIALTVAILCIGNLTFAYLSTLKTATWSATVKSADLTISHEALEFGAMVPGQTNNETLIVTNTGEIPLRVTITGTGEDVTWTLPGVFTLNPDEYKKFYPAITVNSEYTTSGGSLSGSIEVLGEQIH